MDVEENDSLELRCKASGVPQPNITWFWRSLLITDGKESKTRNHLRFDSCVVSLGYEWNKRLAYHSLMSHCSGDLCLKRMAKKVRNLII